MSIKNKEKKIFDTSHKNKFRFDKCFPKMAYKDQERGVILQNVKKSKGIVYGSTSVGVQTPYPFYRKQFTDVDILVPRPKKVALQTEQSLDDWADMNCYYVEELHYPTGTTWRIINRCRNNEVVADVSPMKHKPKNVTINGVRYETLASREQAIRKMIKDPEAIYRREKDIKNLGWVIRIKKARRAINWR